MNLTSRQENTQVQLLSVSKLDSWLSDHRQVKIFTVVLLVIISEKKKTGFESFSALNFIGF